MSEERLVLLFGRFFRPVSAFFPRRTLDGVGADLCRAQMPFAPEDWVAYSFGLSLAVLFLFSPLLFVLFSVAGVGPSGPAAVSAMVFSVVVFTLLFFEPGIAKRRFAREFEADMSLGLQVLAVELNSGARFREALAQASVGGGHFALALRKLLAEERAGAAMGPSLERLSSSVDSLYVRRMCSILGNAYRLSRGKGLGAPLLALSEEMLRNNENELRVYSAKSGMFSQGATVLTIVAPTMVVSLVVIASIFTPIGFPPALLTALIGFGITLAAAALYRVQLASLPVFVRRIGGEDFSGLGRKLYLLGYSSPWDYARKVACFALPVLSLFALAAPGQPVLVLFLLASFASLALVYPHLQFGRMRKDVEDGLPLALEQAAQFTHGERTGEVVDMIAGMGLGRLSVEFGKVSREMRGGARLEDALRKVHRDTGSVLVEKASSLLVRAHKTGVDASAAMQETACCLRRITFIVQESKAATFGERMTQVFGFLMSACLFAVVVSMGRGLGSLLSGTDFTQGPQMLGAAVAGIRINLLLQPFVISWNLSGLENDRKKFLVYLPLLLAGGNALFLALSGVRFV